MRKFVAALMGTACVIALAPVFAAPESVTGVLVDQTCYTKDPKANGGNAHAGMSKTCAEECAKQGQPVALVTILGKVYTVTGDLAANKNAKLLANIGSTVTLRGEVADTGGKLSIDAKSLSVLSRP